MPDLLQMAREKSPSFDNTSMPARILLVTLNAKYIHASLGLRYLWANMARHGSASLQQATSLHEFTIHRPAHEVVDALIDALAHGVPACATHAGDTVEIVGLGVYIWNVTQTTEVVRLLKARRPQVRVVLGGPEVSHEYAHQPVVQMADYLVTGWGDVSFPKLCRALVEGPRPVNKVIAGEQPPLQDLALPYIAYTQDDLAHRVLYVEASRGCPFKCAFCLSALDKTAWAFETNAFLAEMAALHQRGARNFKFVDRTFNLKAATSARILQFFLDRLREQPDEPLQLHFEVVPDNLPEVLKGLLQQFPPGVLQLEIGIQSFNPEVQNAISRKQDNARTQDNLRWLRAYTHAHLHTDLIFGLPGESWSSFADGFDRLYALQPQEIQLGLLKRLRGTPLAAGTYSGMVYEAAPPYTVVQTDAASAQEVRTFAQLARLWDRVANSGRFTGALKLLLAGPTPFGRLADFTGWMQSEAGQSYGLSPEALVDFLARYLVEECKLPAHAVTQTLRQDYVASGARGNPQSLRGTLPANRGLHRQPQALAGRQARHADRVS